MIILAGNVSALPNKLLASLPQEAWDTIRPDMRRSRLVRGQQMFERGHHPEHAYFIEEGIVSIVMGGEGERSVQVAMVGTEGMVGALATLGNHATGSEATMQFPGPALSIPLDTLRRHMDAVPAIRAMCLGYVQQFAEQLMESAASNARATLLERCVRWLLMAHDRMEGDDLPVTHEVLSSMLGVRRPGVTIAMATLQEEGLIRTSRGSLRVLDRPRLERHVSGRPTASRTGIEHGNASRQAQPAEI